MLRPAVLGLLFFAAACKSPCDEGYTPPATFPAALGVDLDAALRDNLDAAVAPGATLTVHVPALGTWISAAGVRSIHTERPIEPRDRFRVGSITKSFTAATVLALENEGVLARTDTASSWVPMYGLPTAITLDHLLHHTAGVFDLTDDVSFLALLAEPWTVDAIIAWALDETQEGHGLLFPAGTAFSYSNTNYLILGRIIEVATEEAFDRAMRARTIARAELGATWLDGFDPPRCSYVDGHLAAVKVVTHDIQPSWMWAAGGMVSTGEDLCTWVTDLYLGDVLPEDDREAMLTPDPLSIGQSMRAYGYGTRYAIRAGQEVVGHTGSTMGFNAEVFLHLRSGVCVAVLTNDFLGRPSAISQPAWALLTPYTSP